MRTSFTKLTYLLAIIILTALPDKEAFSANKVAESFTPATFPPTNWTATHVAGLGGNWVRSTSNFRSAPGCAESPGILLADNWLITHQFTPGAGDSLIFWVSSNYVITALGRLEIKVSTTGNAVGNFQDFLIPVQISLGLLTPNTYFRRAVSLSAQVGTPIYIGFRHIEVAGLFGAVRLDDVNAGGHDVDLTCLLEGHIGGGFFNTPRRDRDTVTVSVREIVSPNNVVESKKVFLDTLGKKVINFALPNQGTSYYIVVDHRNSIRTWSRAGGEFFDGAIPYDFTTGLDKAFGNNMKIKSGVATFFTGDPVHDGIVDSQDLIAIYNDAFVITVGDYVLTDLNWDTITDAEDIVLAYNNSINIVQEERP